MLVVHIDGACEPVNPGGYASYGLVVRDGNVIIHQESKIIGHGPEFSNNVAEYAALEAFLTWRRDTQSESSATVYTDSQLVVRQMTGQWGIHEGLYVATCMRCKQLNNPMKIAYVWVPREQNQEADALSKKKLIEFGIKPRH